MKGFAKVQAIADATAIVDGEHNVAEARQILIHRIGVRIVLHGVKAKQHLPTRSAVEENKCGMAFAIIGIRWQKELSVKLETIGSGEENLFRLDEFSARIVVRNELWSEILQLTIRVQQSRAKRGLLIGMKYRYEALRFHGRNLNAGAARDALWFSS